MRILFASSIVFSFALCAQDSSDRQRTTVDINGHRVAEGPEVSQTKSPNGSETTERVQSINGRRVPIERVEERVVRDDASGRVVERIIHRFGPNGDPGPRIKETVEEQKQPDGSSTTRTTTYRGDINGAMQLAAKSTTEVRKSGSAETVDTVVEQPTLNGSLETVEKRSSVKVKDGPGYREEINKYLRDANGNLSLTVRQSTEHVEQGTQSSDNTAEYEVGADGRLQLHSQTVANTVTRADGSKDIELKIFGQNVPGTVDAGSNKLRLQEQQVIEKRLGPGNSVVEIVNVRRPTISDATVLGPSRQLSETICRGKCDQ